MQRRIDYRVLVGIAVAAVLIIFRRQIVASLLPFALAFILAAFIEPAIESLQTRLRLPRPVAVVVTLAALILVSGYLLSVVMAKIASELVDLGGKLPAYQRDVINIANTLIDRLNDLYEYLPAQVSDYLQTTINDLSRTGIALMGDMIDRSLRAISALPSIMIVIIVTVLATYFLSRDREQLADALYRFAPRRWQEPLRTAQEKITVDLIGFMKAQLVIFLLVSAIASGGLFLMGTRYWVILGLTLGVLDIIPVVGPGLILFPWAGVSVLMSRYDQAIYLCLIFVAIMIVRQTAQAKVLGASIGVHPLTMLVAVYGGIILFGIKGMIVGPVLVIIGKAAWGTGLIPRFNNGDDLVDGVDFVPEGPAKGAPESPRQLPAHASEKEEGDPPVPGDHPLA